MPSRFPFAIAALACAFAGSGDAHAQTQLELSGNARFQIGGGLPVPITGAPPPDGRVQAHSAALARQTTGPDPKRLSFGSGQLTAPGNTLNLPLFANNPSVLQIQTNIAVQLPKGPAVLSAGGRTGAPVTTVTAPPHIGGVIRYSATAHQFGGIAPGRFTGMATVILAPPTFSPTFSPCTITPCPATVGRERPPAMGAHGAPLGFTTQAVEPSGLFVTGVRFTPGGGFTITPLPNPPPPAPNTVTSVGGPWTTGRVTISQPNATPAEIFTITGSDGRVNGTGSLSLVSGALSQRSLSGPNANRGWLNLNVQPLPEPTAGLGAAAALAALVAAHTILKRRR